MIPVYSCKEVDGKVNMSEKFNQSILVNCLFKKLV